MTTAHDTTALAWAARLFLAIGIGAAIACGILAVRTFRFVSESVTLRARFFASKRMPNGEVETGCLGLRH